ncbi:MAG: phosphate propanoyltransferase [Eubacterium sp.]
MENNEVLVEISARHVHLTKEDLNTLFGEGYELTVKKELSQPGQFASNERVKVIGTKGEFPAVSILGPVRNATQIELSLTDARSIGVSAPVRESGDVAGSGACTLVGPKGTVELKEGVIAAKRHIHATKADAERMGLENGQIVSVEIPTSNERSLVFGDVVVRVSDSYALAMHIDTDEANAAGMAPNSIGKIIK